MSLSTHDLREALAEAADAPYDAAGVARLRGVRARVRRDRQRRAATAGGVGMLAIAAVVAGLVLGGARTPSSNPAGPSPSGPAAAPLIAPLPLLYTGLDVVAQVTGVDDQSPAKNAVVTGPVQVAVRCAPPKGSALPDGLQVLVSAMAAGAVDPEGQAVVPCLQDLEPSTEAVVGQGAPRTPSALRVQARFDRPVPAGTQFSVAVLTGDDTIHLDRLRTTPKGYAFVGSYALSDGWIYASGTGTPDPSGAEQVTNGVQVLMEGKRDVHLLVHCVGRQTLTADVGDGSPSSVSCPGTQRVTKTLDLPVARSDQQLLKLRVEDADPGALVEVGLSAR